MNAVASLPDRIQAAESKTIAIRYGGESLTFADLNWKSLLGAARLRSLGMEKGKTVAIRLDRSPCEIAGALAVMRAGAAYVPIDPAWPDERVQSIVADSGAGVLIAAQQLCGRLSTHAAVLTPEELFAPFAAQALPLTPPDGTDLAYIVYTSGSSGAPKGVEITHDNLNHLIAWHLEAFGVSGADRATHIAGVGFDASVWEIWPYLAAGASISIADSLTRTDPALLQRWLVEEAATISFVPTPLAEPMIAMEWPAEVKLRFLLTGGDTLHTAPRAGLPFIVVNNYGPSECTVVATSGAVPVAPAGLPSIGRAIRGAAIYLLDQRKQPVQEGEIGEIYIGGGGVGRGYRNLPRQTADSFMPDPFSSTPLARMYRTGDLGAFLPNGEIAFHGRADNQEKIRGNRIELDEIVAVLNRHQGVAFNSVISGLDTGGEKQLIAYVLPAEGAAPTEEELQKFAAKYLPSYMVPPIFVRLSTIPLSSNGKLDREGLPAPTPGNRLSERTILEAGTPAEAALLAIVRSLLGTDRIGVDDDFFLAGGHSLLGTQLVLRAREAFGAPLTLRDLFEFSTVALLAARIEELILAEIGTMTEEEAIRLTGNSTEDLE